MGNPFFLKRLIWSCPGPVKTPLSRFIPPPKGFASRSNKTRRRGAPYVRPLRVQRARAWPFPIGIEGNGPLNQREDRAMPAIGYVSRTDKGFKGNLKTLSIKAPIEFIANSSKTTDKQPDYIVLVDGVEVGAAWNRVSKHSGNEYVSMQLSAPEFGPRKLYANLGQAAGQDDPDTFAIIWNAGD